MVLLTPTAWRLPHWLVALGSTLALAIYAGLVQPRRCPVASSVDT